MAKKDYALGSYEAAALMGVHFTRPGRMFDAGVLTGRLLDPVAATKSDRSFAIFSSLSCQENFAGYEIAQAGKAGRTYRPRAWLDDRPAMLKRLAAMTPKIDYDDAIGTAEAAKLLGVHISLVPRLVTQGKICGRVPWNPRHSGGSRGLIISRRSCEANRREVAAAEKAGKKRGKARYA